MNNASSEDNKATPIFTNKRRDLLAKTIMDISKILIAAAFANELFSSDLWIKNLSVVSIIAFVFIGILVCPKKEEK